MFEPQTGWGEFGKSTFQLADVELCSMGSNGLNFSKLIWLKDSMGEQMVGSRDDSRYVLKLELSGLPRRFNQGQGSHWSVRYRESQKWHKRFVGKMLLLRLSPPHSPLAAARVVLVRRSSRAPDYDGLVQSFKPVMDALKKCLIISDDSMAVIGVPEYRWIKGNPNEGGIEIIVESVTRSQHTNLVVE